VNPAVFKYPEPPKVPTIKLSLLTMFDTTLLCTEANAWAAGADSAGAPAAGANSAGAPAAGANSAGAPAALAAIAGAPAAGAASAAAPAAGAAMGCPREKAAGGLSRNDSDLRKFVGSLREIVQNFLDRYNLRTFTKVYHGEEYFCEIREVLKLSGKIKRGQAFAVLTLRIAYNHETEDVTIQIPTTKDSAWQILPSFGKEQFIKHIALNVTKGDRVDTRMRLDALNGETFNQMARRVAKLRNSDSTFPHVTAKQLLRYYQICNPDKAQACYGTKTKLRKGTDVPLYCPMPTCDIKCYCIPLPGT